MRKMDVTEMMAVNGGAKITKTARCGVCGKKHSCTISYVAWLPLAKVIASSCATIGAGQKAKQCGYSHF